MLPGASTIIEERYFNVKVSTGGAGPAPPAFLGLFIGVAGLVEHGGAKTMSALEFSPLGPLFLLSAGSLGDFNLGEIGGDNEGFALALAVSVGGVEGVDFGEGALVGELFLTELRLSKLKTWLQVG